MIEKKIIEISYLVLSYDDLSQQDRELLDAAEDALRRPYSPYFNFGVGAAVRTESGIIYQGANFENAAANGSIHAEVSAINNANMHGEKNIASVAVIGRHEDGSNAGNLTPCGGCRQSIYEIADLYDRDIKIITSSTAKDDIKIMTIRDLLPFAFGPKSLGVDLAKYR